MGLSLKRTPKYPPREPRTAVSIRSVVLLPDDRELSVRIMNISADGFMAEAAQPIGAETRLGLSIPGYGIVRASVRWSDGGLLGAVFEDPLLLSWVQRPSD